MADTIIQLGTANATPRAWGLRMTGYRQNIDVRAYTVDRYGTVGNVEREDVMRPFTIPSDFDLPE